MVARPSNKAVNAVQEAARLFNRAISLMRATSGPVSIVGGAPKGQPGRRSDRRRLVPTPRGDQPRERRSEVQRSSEEGSPPSEQVKKTKRRPVTASRLSEDRSCPQVTPRSSRQQETNYSLCSRSRTAAFSIASVVGPCFRKSRSSVMPTGLRPCASASRCAIARQQRSPAS
jgi:hypothetical protein